MSTAVGSTTHRATDHPEREIGRYESVDTHTRAPTTTLVIIAGLHGNEPAGIAASQRVIDKLNHEHPSAFNGRVIALRGNTAALALQSAEMRYITHDLNRLFTDEQIALPASTSPEHEQMQELLASLRAIRAQCERMVLIDLHTTSSDMPPVVVLEDAIPTRTLARRLTLPIYLGFEEELSGLLMDRVTNELGAIAMVVEGGQHQDPHAIDAHAAVIWTMLDATGILPLSALHHPSDPTQTLRTAAGEELGKIYDTRYRHPITDPSFEIQPGIATGKKIKRDVTIIAIENERAITSPVRGRVFMPNMQPLKRPGDDGFFIVRRVGEGWLGLSARLRKQAWLHALIAHMPGVYPRPDHTLLVDADLAAVLRRQILHLLGYRLIRHDNRSGGHGIMRVFNGISAFARAFIRGPIRPAPDPNDPRFWIVRRHTLDR